MISCSTGYWESSGDSVSYTHLDVYKRQVLWCHVHNGGDAIITPGIGFCISVDYQNIVDVCCGIAMEGGYYDGGCSGDGRSEGLKIAIAYIAYSRCIVNNPINPTAFGAVSYTHLDVEKRQIPRTVPDKREWRSCSCQFGSRAVSYTHLLSTHKHWTALAYTKLKIFKNESKTL